VADIEVAFATAPVGARRRRLPPVVIGLTVVALLALAVAKPWRGGVDPGPSPDPSGAAIAAASGSTAPAGSAGSSVEPEGTGGLTPGGIKGPPRLGAWGISVGTAILGSSTFEWANWSEWVPLEPVSDGPEPSPGDPRPLVTDCTSVPTLAARATVLGITVPEAMSTDFSVLGWFSEGPWEATLDEELSRIDSPGRSEFAALARRDGLAFPDGRYELHILTPDHLTALGFCIDTDAAARAAAGAPDQAITAQIVHDLAARSGAWGVGVGGNGPRLVREEPWTDWAAVDPGVAWGGTSLTLWPDTGLCMSAPRLLDRPSLVAITVPSGLVPDWRVAGWWTDGSDTASLEGIVRQISPPGNRRITYLERVDGARWPDGRYEFDIQAGDHRSSLTVCIGAR
jgi:hypothetical protein